jgi:uncharacterized protein with HXXEE motif
MGGLLTGQPHIAGNVAPWWIIFLPIAFLAHICEESLGGPGFPAWTQSTFGTGVSPARFVLLSGSGLLVMTAFTIAALRNRRVAWLAVTVATTITVNGLLHAIATVAYSTYSPGTVTGLFVFIPLGSLTLWSLFRRLPRHQFVLASLGGVAFHALVLVIAFGFS